MLIKLLVLARQVQRHLQLRIEAQGRYLESVLRRAVEVLEGSLASSTTSSLSLSPPHSCVTSSSSSEAESRAGTRECTVQSKRAVLHSRRQGSGADEEADAAENGSSEIDLNR